MSVQTTISINNQMTAGLMNINNAVKTVIGSLYSMSGAGQIEIDTSSLELANKQLEGMSKNIIKAQLELDEMEDEIQRSVHATDRLEGEQKAYNRQLEGGTYVARGLGGAIKALLTSYAAIQGTRAFIGLSDDLSQIESRLNLASERVNALDGANAKASVELIEEEITRTQTLNNAVVNVAGMKGVLNGQEESLRLQEMIYKSAQRTGSEYSATASAVAKLGLQTKGVFSSMQEIVDFSEQLNKLFVIGGASAMESASAMHQLTQAMGSGRLQGDEYVSIVENAPMVASAIEEFMRGMGYEGTMKEWSSKGLITAEIIKNAMFSAADETDERYAKMPKTFARIGNQMRNALIMELRPATNAFNEFLNSQKAEEAIAKITSAFGDIAYAVSEVAKIATEAIVLIIDNANWLIPAILSVAGAYKVWSVATTVQKVATRLLTAEIARLNMANGTTATTGIGAMLSLAKAYLLPVLAIGVLVGGLTAYYYATGKASSISEALVMALDLLSKAVIILVPILIGLKMAIFGVNSAMAVNPIFLIIMLISAIIYQIIRWIQKVGGLQVAWAIMVDKVLTLNDKLRIGVKQLADNIITAFENMRADALEIFQGVINGVIDMINGALKAINTLIGTEFKMIAHVDANVARENNIRKQAERDRQIGIMKVEAERRQRARSKEIINLRLQSQARTQTGEDSLLNGLLGGRDYMPDVLQGQEQMLDALGSIDDNSKAIKDNLRWDNNNLTDLRDLMAMRAIKELTGREKLAMTNNFTFSGNITKDVDVKKLVKEVERGIEKSLERQLNGGVS